jgi:hypothetical protein
MPRVLLSRKGAVKHLASINVTHDGSLRLSLVREGSSDRGWLFRSGGPGLEEVERTARKTKEISIHTTGRVNYHFDQDAPRFIPPLMDLVEPVSVVGYRVPAFDLLDTVQDARQGDVAVEVPESCTGVMQFDFLMLPAVVPALPGEVTRFGVEGLFALACVNTASALQPLLPGVPERAFVTLRPNDGFAEQAISEPNAFLRFRKAMFANDLRATAESAGTPIPEGLIEAAISEGPGLYPPNGEGVWTVVTVSEMRVRPALNVHFEEEGLTAEVVELRPGDTRLATVRVRFRVRDSSGRHIKGVVPIRRIELNAEL